MRHFFTLWLSILTFPAFSTPAIWSRISMSRIFRSCIFDCPVFSCIAFSVALTRVLRKEVGAHSLTLLLRELHWLKVPERIQFRSCVLAYRCLIGTAPSYLAETLHSTADVGSRWRLRSASKPTLVIPTTRRTTLGDRAFSVTAARAWNALPSSARSAPSLLQFRRDRKTALFQSSYSSP